jgi:hypothetical protein
VGKTQLAADCAEQVWAAAEVELLVWVAGGDRVGLRPRGRDADRNVAVPD